MNKLNLLSGIEKVPERDWIGLSIGEVHREEEAENGTGIDGQRFPEYVQRRQRVGLKIQFLDFWKTAHFSETKEFSIFLTILLFLLSNPKNDESQFSMSLRETCHVLTSTGIQFRALSWD